MGFFSKLLGLTPAPREIPKLGRNDPCWCGSGKKYKKCHMESDQRRLSKIRASQCTTSS